MKKIFIFSLLISLSIFSGVSASDVSEVGTRVQKVQATTTGVPAVPAGKDEKGYIGEIISKMFDATGMIKNEFITAFQSIQGSFANTLPKWDGQKFVAGTITDSGSNIGIGITNPIAKLHVNGNVQAGNKYTATYGDDTHYGYFEVKRNDGQRGAYFGYGDGDKKIQLAMDNADKFIISGGNVGIEISSPQYKLDVNGTITSRGVDGLRFRQSNYSVIQRNDNANYWMLITNSGSTDGSYNTLRPLRVGLSDGSVSIGGSALNVTHGGNVGIGVVSASATQKLDVNGKIRMRIATVDGDPADTVATKGYVDSKIGSGTAGSTAWGAWQNVTASRNSGGWNRNTSGGALAVSYNANNGSSFGDVQVYISPTGTSTDAVLVVSSSSFRDHTTSGGDYYIDDAGAGFFIVPPGQYYRISGNPSAIRELVMGNTGGGTGGSADNLGNHTATQNLNMGNNKITNLATPTNANDVATKGYVDSKVSTACTLETTTVSRCSNIGMPTCAAGWVATGPLERMGSCTTATNYDRYRAWCSRVVCN